MNVFARSHRICRSTRLRLPQSIPALAVSGARRHLTQQQLPAKSSLGALPTTFTPTPPPVRPAQPAKTRQQHFESLFAFVDSGLAAKRNVRNTSWVRLFQLAETEEQMVRVAAMFPRWRAMRKTFEESDSELFVRRCEELSCAPLALAVFSDHPKNGFPLTHTAGLQLVHALHLRHPLAETITACALLKSSGFPGPEGSLPTCAMLVSACLQALTTPNFPLAPSPASAAAGEDAAAALPDPRAAQLLASLLPALKHLAFTTPPSVYRPPPPGPAAQHLRARFDTKPKVWLSAALRRIQTRLGKVQGMEGEAKWVGGAVAKFAAEGAEVKEIEGEQAPVETLVSTEA